jgi:hypothetical protein
MVLALIVGCGHGNPLGRLAVSGRVTLDGIPLDRGSISFGTQSPDGVSSGAVIKNGAFEIPTAKGLPPGKYLVQITSPKLPPDKSGGGSGEPAAPGPLSESDHATAVGAERIAPAYNVESKIIVEVEAGKPCRFNFDTKSK